MKKQSGFTLIELMVVMAIIAILATAGLTAYSSYTKKARDSARLQIAREIMTKVEQLANGGKVPTPLELINFLNTENFASTAPAITPSASGLALPDIDPLHGRGQCISGFCGFYYVTFTDNTYLIGYGIEHSDSATIVPNSNLLLGNPIGNFPNYVDDPALVGIEDLLYNTTSPTTSWWGNFIGNNTASFSGGIVNGSTVKYMSVISSDTQYTNS